MPTCPTNSTECLWMEMERRAARAAEKRPILQTQPTRLTLAWLLVYTSLKHSEVLKFDFMRISFKCSIFVKHGSGGWGLEVSRVLCVGEYREGRMHGGDDGCT